MRSATDPPSAPARLRISFRRSSLPHRSPGMSRPRTATRTTGTSQWASSRSTTSIPSSTPTAR
eukprot:15478688-Alexandrium_andersonii.AAC.1